MDFFVDIEITLTSPTEPGDSVSTPDIDKQQLAHSIAYILECDVVGSEEALRSAKQQ